MACKNTRKKSKNDISTIVISGIHKINSMPASEESSLPRVQLFVGVDHEPPIKTEVVADTGAQVTVAGKKHLKHLGLKQHQLRKPSHSLQHAGGSALEILGSYPVYIVHNHHLIQDEVYFAKGVENMYYL